MPDFNEKFAELGGDIHFVMVNITDGSRETIETASAFIDENGYDFPVFYDTSSEAAMAYGAYSLPTSFFINAEGHVIAQAMGAIPGSAAGISSRKPASRRSPKGNREAGMLFLPYPAGRRRASRALSPLPSRHPPAAHLH